MILTQSDFVCWGILIYVGMWTVYALRYLKLAKKPDIDLNRLQNCANRTKKVMQLGWISIFITFLLCFIIFPSVTIVKSEAPVCGKHWHSHELSDDITFYTIEGYVPFTYDGKSFPPFGKYVYNNTDSVLAKYNVHTINHSYSSAHCNYDPFPPRSVSACDEGFDYFFQRPYVSPSNHPYIYKPDKRGGLNTSTIWTLTFATKVKYDIECLEQEHRNDLNRHSNPYRQRLDNNKDFMDSIILKTLKDLDNRAKSSSNDTGIK